MRVTFGLASMTIVTGFCLVQACSSDDTATPTDADAGGNPPGTSTSSGSTSSTTSSGGSTSSTSSTGGTDSGSDAPSGETGGKSVMTFFATSTGTGAKGGDLGGLAGADQKCTDLAKAVGGGDHTWAAYLSTGGGGGVNAKDRIGPGPWKNQKGVEIAKDVAALHAQAFNIKGADILDEGGKAVPAKEHDILTGTKADGTATNNTCANWTSDNNGQGSVGHTDSDTSTNTGDKWNAAHNVDCDQQSIAQANGAGRIYCFAKD